MTRTVLCFSIAIALQACGGTTSNPNKGAPVDGGRDASGVHDSGAPEDASPPNDASSAHDSPFDCGAVSCNGATSYCYAIVGGARIPDANAGPSWACEPYDAGCGPSCACTPCGSMLTNEPGGCGCYQSPSDQVTCLLCAP